MTLATLDQIIFVIYLVGLLFIAYWVSRDDQSHQKDTNDYFLAGNSLPWWAIGASLIAANISAEQIIGMSGSGYAIGLGIASYEWMAALTLMLVGKYLLPIFLKRKIYTMPQFLQQRFDNRVRTTLALFWLAVYVFVNLTAVLWLGALAVNAMTGYELTTSMLLLAVFSVAYSLYGGLKAVAYTDILQVVLLVFGGIFMSYLALNMISGDTGVIAGFNILLEKAPQKFDMILTPDNPYYKDLPGIAVLVGGLWFMNLSYWGFNQYIIQRALAAQSLREAQKGIAFAAFLKLLMPIIVVLPGIAAVLILPDLAKPDQAYPQLMTLMPVGLKGLIFAALVAAILSSLASMTNSIATLFTMDVYAQLKPNQSQKHYVTVGRVSSLVALVVALLTAKPLLGEFDQAFQFIQEFTGFFTPGIVVLFLLGMFWQRTTALAALVSAVGSLVLSLALKQFWPELPFMDRVGYVGVFCAVFAVATTLLARAPAHAGAVEIKDIDFSTSRGFNFAFAIVCLILVVFYSIWW